MYGGARGGVWVVSAFGVFGFVLSVEYGVSPALNGALLDHWGFIRAVQDNSSYLGLWEGRGGGNQPLSGGRNSLP